MTKFCLTNCLVILMTNFLCVCVTHVPDYVYTNCAYLCSSFFKITCARLTACLCNSPFKITCKRPLCHNDPSCITIAPSSPESRPETLDKMAYPFYGALACNQVLFQLFSFLEFRGIRIGPLEFFYEFGHVREVCTGFPSAFVIGVSDPLDQVV